MSKSVWKSIPPLWRSDDPEDLYGPDGWRVYVLVDYLLSTLPHNNPALMQRELVRRGSFTGWLNGLFAAESELKSAALLSELTRGFWMRGYAQTLNNRKVMAGASGTGPLPVLRPRYGRRSRQVATLYRYDLAGGLGTTSTRRLIPVDSVSARRHMLLQQEYDNDTQRWTVAFRQDEQMVPLLPTAEDYTVSFGKQTRQRGLAAFVFPPQGDEATITWFDLHDCQASGGCSNRELPGIPIWSPNGEQALFSDDPNSEIGLLRTDLHTHYLTGATYNFVLPCMGDRSQILEGQPLTSAKNFLCRPRTRPVLDRRQHDRLRSW